MIYFIILLGFVLCFGDAGIEPRLLYMPGEYFTTELCFTIPSPLPFAFWNGVSGQNLMWNNRS